MITNYYEIADRAPQVGAHSKPVGIIDNPLDITINFDLRAFCQLAGGNPDIEYDIRFINDLSGQTVYSCKLKSGHWAASSFAFFVPWRIEVTSPDGKAQVFPLDLKGQRVFIRFDSSALGDTIAWLPIAVEFQKVHECKLFISTYHNDLCRLFYPALEYVGLGESVDDAYAGYKLGIYGDGAQSNWNPRDTRTRPLQATASDILGLKYRELRPPGPTWTKEIQPRSILPACKPQVAISTTATAQAKFWNRPGAWQVVVDYLKDQGFEVIEINKENPQLRNVRHITTPTPVDAARVLAGCVFCVGLGSGIPWLAWALGKKVVMISGFSDPMCEFQADNYRVTSVAGACTGCFNDPAHAFDRADWLWCPRKRNFECTASITPEVVIEQIERLRADLWKQSI